MSSLPYSYIMLFDAVHDAATTLSTRLLRRAAVETDHATALFLRQKALTFRRFYLDLNCDDPKEILSAAHILSAELEKEMSE